MLRPTRHYPAKVLWRAAVQNLGRLERSEWFVYTMQAIPGIYYFTDA